jgi:hypothetical protein
MTEAPKLLVEWSSPWQEFRTAIGPALGRSPAALAGETPIGLFPLRGILLSWGAEAILLAMIIILPAKLALLQPFRPPTISKHEVIYYHGDELPQVQDFGGAQAGRSGRAGGQEAYHRTQTLRVARGNSARDKVVDAPNLKLPISLDPVANLLAVKPVPGPPPAEGLKSSLTPPTPSKNAIIAPPPETFRELNRATPGLASAIVAPPPANVSADRRQTMGLSTAIIAPAPSDVPRDQSHSVVSMTSQIVQPSPSDVQREPPPLRGPAAATANVVPPPISAPQREGTQAAKLNMPPPAVIAPPPSQVTSDRNVSGASLSDPKIVPPPVQVGGRSTDPRAIPGLTGANQIVPPPPSDTTGTSLIGGGRGHNQKAGGFGTALSADNVVPPPPSFASGAGSGATGARNSGASALGSPQIVPPPPSLNTAAGNPLSGHGSGAKGGGLGGPFDTGSVLAPPSPAGGTGGGKGVIVSSQPGSAVGVPGNATPGSIAMSPSGGNKPGLGGSGGGAGLGHGNGPGSGMTGEGTGAAKTGTGKGSDPNSRDGMSPYPGPGGAGNGTNGQPPIPGVAIAGGNTASIVNLPSFGSGDSDPSIPGRSPMGGKRRGNLDVTVEGTSRSGGAFNFYGMLPGDKVYTKYIPTSAGTVVMQFADATSAKRRYSQELTSPEAILSSLPVILNHSRIIIRCQLNTSGVLRDFQKIEADPGAPTNKVVAALSAWKFIPALRGNDPVEVNVLLGFNIDTR